VAPHTTSFAKRRVRKFCEHVSYDRYASWAPTSLAQRALAPECGGAWIALPPEFSPFSRFAKTRYLASTGGEKRRRSRA
jgi:rRNA maturation protein Nop10